MFCVSAVGGKGEILPPSGQKSINAALRKGLVHQQVSCNRDLFNQSTKSSHYHKWPSYIFTDT